MFRVRFVALLLVLVASFSFGQSATPAPAPVAPVVVQATQSFSFTANAIALPGKSQTVAAAVVGGTFAITDKFSLRQDNIVANSTAMNGYYGGFQYELPQLSSKLNNVSVFDASQFHFYVTASAGIDHVGSAQHYSFLAGGGVNYGTGKLTYNLAELRLLIAPGFANKVPLFSSGIKFSF